MLNPRESSGVTGEWNSMAKIINRIRKLRFENNEMTQEQLAKLSGCTRQTIIAVEQGKYLPSLELAFQIAQSLGAHLEDVFNYES